MNLTDAEYESMLHREAVFWLRIKVSVTSLLRLGLLN